MQKSIDRRLIAYVSAISIALVAFLTIMILVLCGHDFWLDKFNVVVANNRTKAWTGFFKVFTHLGSFYAMLLFALVGIILLFVMKNKRMSAFFALCFTSTGVANFIIKRVIKRIRPEHLMMISESGFSFPSGHSMMSFVVFAMLLYFVYKTIKNKALKIGLISLCSVLIAMIGFSRIHLGVHYLTDVLAGWLITFVIVGIFIILYNTKLFSFLKDKKVKTDIHNA